MKYHISAGGVLYDPKTNKICLVYKKSRNEWLLPKGHLEIGETPEQAALREISEETGYQEIELANENAFLGQLEFSFKDRGAPAKKLVYYYLVKLVSDSLSRTQEKDHEGLTNQWFALEEAKEKATFENLRIILEKAGEILSAKS